MSLSPEDKIIIWIISLGIFIGLFLYIGGNISQAIQPSPILVAVFIAIGFSAAIYRFLGGLEGSGMKVGPARLAGTAAAFLAITWFLNQSLEKQWTSSPVLAGIDLQQLGFTSTDWVPVNKRSGQPVKVELALKDSIIRVIEPDGLNFADRNLVLEKPKENSSNFAFNIKSLFEGESLMLGGINQQELSKNKLFSSFGDNDNILFTSDNLPPNKRNISVARELPFLISTGEYSQNLTRFTLVDRQTRAPILESSIRLRGGKIYEVKDRVFLILITQVDHTAQRKRDEPYAKFGIIELNPS
ncbi:MAG: hypothetical protein HRU41_32690 [Saprospiraceae bacterium]|nr:hypothetical protein [Saprospiraceae bacterium]